MGLKFYAFLAVGGTAAYFGANLPLVDTPEIKINKNLFTSAYTLQMEQEGITMKYDKRYEKEMGVLTDSIQNLVKVSETLQKEGKKNDEVEQEVNEKIRTSLKIR